MDSLPLHPLVVHLPIALAALLPLVAAGVVLATLRGLAPRKAFAALALAEALLLGSGVAAKVSGEQEEERVEPFVGEAALEAHEEAADAFLLGSGLTLALFVAAAAVPERASRTLGILGLVGTLGVLGLGIRVGHAGGELVYRHGAANAYVSAATGGAMRARGTEVDDD